ncbi:hypothetical protein NQ317_002904 [Molorchus minor]|uniref:non-specific serine/threonine protein kinase n=1 Tax=Molorchus minor TaxID=1323400 RepID=A0ABQ9JKB0_9CUCU|nr:hypothetical protein NQ317_002904 [Molorchus minor]
MSVRALGTRLFKHGTALVRHICKKQLNTAKITDKINAAQSAPPQPNQLFNNQLVPRQFGLRTVGVQIGLQARRILIDNVLNHSNKQPCCRFKEESCKKGGPLFRLILYGDSGPFFALVGVSLASGTGILTKEDELEGVCWEIRYANNSQREFIFSILNTLSPSLNLMSVRVYLRILGLQMIQQYSNLFLTYELNCSRCFIVKILTGSKDETEFSECRINAVTCPSFRACPRAISSPEATSLRSGSKDYEAISKIKWHYHDVDIDENRFENSPITLDDLAFRKPIAKGSNAVVYEARILTPQEKNMKTEFKSDKNVANDDGTNFPLALKMMFNYDIQSSAMAILKAMYRETVPARSYYSNVGGSDWEIELAKRNRYLPPHPNIVVMFSVFTDYIPELEDCRGLYPAALPRRIHSEGEGRNMSLFLLMKRYNTNLKDYIPTSSPSIRTSILLLAQLLEGVAHLTAHSIAHRDLKADNLLLDTSELDVPILVISDFGCCLSDKQNGLMLPYTSYDVDKGGNTALMAPEIIGQQPGTFSVLNYSKSDLWATGTIAYEIFGNGLPDDVPSVVRMLIKNILKPNPNKRLNPEVAANICQLFLWAPSVWLKPGIKLPTSAEILQWLLSLTTKILCEGRINNKSFSQNSKTPDSVNETPEAGTKKMGRRTYPEYLLISSFLRRAKLANIRAALSWIQDVSFETDY